jgi:pyruvate/2-oxoglutarate dehydrogenase complex dihydrolipoamide dehydrogenase (E3) component
VAGIGRGLDDQAMSTVADPAAQAYDVVVIGTGSAGKPLAAELARAGRSVLAVERERVGGECAYLACIPSKTLLLAARRHRDRVGGRTHAGSARPDAAARAAWAAATALREVTTGHRDDSGAATGLEKDGVTLVRGAARLEGRSVLVTTTTGPVRARWRQALVLATGAEAIVPPIDGLDELDPALVWTSADALSSDELPPRLAILGGGPIGCELAQVYASFGSTVTLIETSSTLLPHEPDWLGETLAAALREVGVDVRTSTEAVAVGTGPGPGPGPDGGVRVRTADGATVDADRILVAVGKRPRSAGNGLESVGITPREDGALEVDARCRVIGANGPMDDVFAVGDLTAIAPYTHTANHHARVVAAHLLGTGRDADHTGIPRVVYTDPPVLAAGDTEATARQRGVNVLSERHDVTSTSRSAIERALDPADHRPAELQLLVDADSGLLIGAAAIGPEADSWAAELALAVRARLPVRTLADHLHAFPSWTEAIHVPARALAERFEESKPARTHGS